MEIIINFEVIHKLNHLSHGIQVEFLKNIMDMSLQGGHLHAAHGTDFRAFIALTKKIQNIDFGLCQLSDQHEIIQEAVFTLFDTLEFPADFLRNHRSDRGTARISILYAGNQLFLFGILRT